MDCKATISIHAPPRGATHPDSAVHQARPPISIHAPPRGATAHGQRGVFALFISIHAPPRGATAKVWRQSCCLIISIHAPPRGATSGVHKNRNDTVISIHAPPRGATFFTQEKNQQGAYFNSRPSARGDILREFPFQTGLFQFTPLREGRRFHAHSKNTSLAFQFTPLREGRLRCPCSIKSGR